MTTELKASALSIGSKVKVTKGCRALGINKGTTAIIRAIVPLGAEYSHAVEVTLAWAGRPPVRLYARHANRLADLEVAFNNGSPENRILVIRKG